MVASRAGSTYLAEGYTGWPAGEPRSGPEEQGVLDAALARADALASGDGAALAALLHPDFRWTSHAGEQLDRDAYLRSNVGGAQQWSAQRLDDVEVLLHRDAAVLRCRVVDTVDRGSGPEDYAMPMTQVWVRDGGAWVSVAGHAGPGDR